MEKEWICKKLWEIKMINEKFQENSKYFFENYFFIKMRTEKSSQYILSHPRTGVSCIEWVKDGVGGRLLSRFPRDLSWMNWRLPPRSFACVRWKRTLTMRYFGYLAHKLMLFYVLICIIIMIITITMIIMISLFYSHKYLGITTRLSTDVVLFAKSNIY